MKLLMTTDTLGGVWTYSLELSRALAPYGVEIALATMGRALTPDQREAAGRLGHVRVFESEYRLEWMQHPWEDVAAAGDWLLDVSDEFGPDVVHLNNFVHGGLEWGVPVLVVGHSCVFSWFREVRGEAPGPEWNEYREQVTAGLRAADLVVAPTRVMLDWLDEFYGPLGRTRTILNGRSPAEVRVRTKQHAVLTAGRLWDEAKNAGAVAEVAPRLAWPVFVAGEDQHPDGASRSRLPGGTAGPDDTITNSGPARQAGPTDGRSGVTLEGVRLLGRLDAQAMAEWFGRASVYVLPARYEPFGLTPLEAALAGCALVLGDIPTLREVWGEAAWFVPSEDREALAAALIEITGDHALRRELAERARRRARRLTASSMARTYLVAYGELLTGSGRDARRAGRVKRQSSRSRAGTAARRPMTTAETPGTGAR